MVVVSVSARGQRRSVKTVESGDAIRWRSSVAARQWSFPSLAAHPVDRIRDFGEEL